MPPGLLDLSMVTELLAQRLTTFASTYQPLLDHPFSLEFTALAPDAARHNMTKDCEVSLFLFHVAADKQHRNTFPRGGPAQASPYQPLALVLYYLVTAYANRSASREQTAMSAVLKYFHETPIIRVPGAAQEITVTLEPQTLDEVGRLWQATARSMRLSAVYRVSVVFIEAPVPEPPQIVRHPPDLEGRVLDGAGDRPIALAASADQTGFAELRVDHAGFASHVTTVALRALPMFETTSDPPEPRHFLIDGDRLALRVPLLTPAGHYQVTVVVAPDKPTIEVDLDVAAPVDVVVAVGRIATIAVDDGGFTRGATTARFAFDDPATHLPLPDLTPTTNPGPNPGEMSIRDPDTLVVGVPAVIPAGRHGLRIVPDPTKPERGLSLRVEVR